MYIYDVRVQEETQNIDVLTVDGLTINVQISLRFQLFRDRLPALHQEIGPNYREKVVLPIMCPTPRLRSKNPSIHTGPAASTKNRKCCAYSWPCARRP